MSIPLPVVMRKIENAPNKLVDLVKISRQMFNVSFGFFQQHVIKYCGTDELKKEV